MKRILVWVLLISLILIGCDLQPEVNVGNIEVQQEQASADESPAENVVESTEVRLKKSCGKYTRRKTGRTFTIY